MYVCMYAALVTHAYVARVNSSESEVRPALWISEYVVLYDHELQQSTARQESLVGRGIPFVEGSPLFSQVRSTLIFQIRPNHEVSQIVCQYRTLATVQRFTTNIWKQCIEMTTSWPWFRLFGCQHLK